MGAALGVDVTAGTVRVVSVATGNISSQPYEQQARPQARRRRLPQWQRRRLYVEQQRQHQQQWRQRQKENGVALTSSHPRAAENRLEHAASKAGGSTGSGTPAAQSCRAEPRAAAAAATESAVVDEQTKDGAAGPPRDSPDDAHLSVSSSAVAPAADGPGPAAAGEEAVRRRAMLSEVISAAGGGEATSADGAAATAAGETAAPATQACTDGGAAAARTRGTRAAPAAESKAAAAGASAAAVTAAAATAGATPKKGRQREGLLGRSQQERQFLFVQQVHHFVEHVEMRRLAHTLACCPAEDDRVVKPAPRGARCCCCGKLRRQRVIYFLMLDWRDVEDVVKLGLPYLEIGCHLALTGSGCFELQALMQRLLLLYMENLPFSFAPAAEAIIRTSSSGATPPCVRLSVAAADSCWCSYCARVIRPSVSSEDFAPCPCFSSSSFYAAAGVAPASSRWRPPSPPPASPPAAIVAASSPAQTTLPLSPSPSLTTAAAATAAVAFAAPVSSAAFLPATRSLTALTFSAASACPWGTAAASMGGALSSPSAAAERPPPTAGWASVPPPAAAAATVPIVAAASSSSLCVAASVPETASLPPPAAAAAQLSHVAGGSPSPRQHGAAAAVILPASASSSSFVAADAQLAAASPPLSLARDASDEIAAAPVVGPSELDDKNLEEGPSIAFSSVEAAAVLGAGCSSPNEEARDVATAAKAAATAAPPRAAGRAAAVGTSGATTIRTRVWLSAGAAAAAATKRKPPVIFPRKTPAMGSARPCASPKTAGAALTAARLWSAMPVDIRRQQVAHLVISFSRESVCIIEALDFLMQNFPTTVFRYEGTCRAMNEAPAGRKEVEDFYECSLTPEERREFYPYLLVNIKAGVSVHKVLAASSSRAAGAPALVPATTANAAAPAAATAEEQEAAAAPAGVAGAAAAEAPAVAGRAALQPSKFDGSSSDTGSSMRGPTCEITNGLPALAETAVPPVAATARADTPASSAAAGPAAAAAPAVREGSPSAAGGAGAISVAAEGVAAGGGHGCISQRIGGSTIGGATFMGLCRLLLADDEASPRELLQLAVDGDSRVCDMLVKDIYGGGYEAIGLKPSTIASTFGKLQHLPLRLLREYAIPEANEKAAATAVKQAVQERFFFSMRSAETTCSTATTAAPSDAAAAAAATAAAPVATSAATPTSGATRPTCLIEERLEVIPASAGRAGLPPAQAAAAESPGDSSAAAAAAPTPTGAREAAIFAREQVGGETGLAMALAAKETSFHAARRCRSWPRNLRVSEVHKQKSLCSSCGPSTPLLSASPVSSKCLNREEERFGVEMLIDNRRTATAAASVCPTTAIPAGTVCLRCCRRCGVRRCCHEASAAAAERRRESDACWSVATRGGEREECGLAEKVTTGRKAIHSEDGRHQSMRCCCCYCFACRVCRCCCGCSLGHRSDCCCRWRRRRSRRSSSPSPSGEGEGVCSRLRRSTLFSSKVEESSCLSCMEAWGRRRTAGVEQCHMHFLSHRGVCCMPSQQEAAARLHSDGSNTCSSGFVSRSRWVGGPADELCSTSQEDICMREAIGEACGSSNTADQRWRHGDAESVGGNARGSGRGESGGDSGSSCCGCMHVSGGCLSSSWPLREPCRRRFLCRGSGGSRIGTSGTSGSSNCEEILREKHMCCCCGGGTGGSKGEETLYEEHVCCCWLRGCCDSEGGRERRGRRSSGGLSCWRSGYQSSSSGDSSSSEQEVGLSTGQCCCSSTGCGGVCEYFRRDSCSSMSNASSDCWHRSRRSSSSNSSGSNSSSSSSEGDEESGMDEGSGAEEDEDAVHDEDFLGNGSSRKNSDSTAARRLRPSGGDIHSRSPVRAKINIDSRHLRKPNPADIVRSLLTMMSFNVAQQAYLHAVLHGLKRIVLAGFLLDVPGFLASLQHSVRFWSKNECKVYFCSLSAFLGALGACLSHERCLPGVTTGSELTRSHALFTSSRKAGLRVRSKDVGWHARKVSSSSSTRKSAVRGDIHGGGSSRRGLLQRGIAMRSQPLLLRSCFPAAEGEHTWTKQQASSELSTRKREGDLFDEEEDEEKKEEDDAYLVPPFSPSTPTALVPDGWQQQELQVQQQQNRMDIFSPAPQAEQRQQPCRNIAAGPREQQVLACSDRRSSDTPVASPQLLPSPFLPPPPPFRPSAASCLTHRASLAEGLTPCLPLELHSDPQDALCSAQPRRVVRQVQASAFEAGAREGEAAGQLPAARALGTEPPRLQQGDPHQQPDEQL